MIAVQIKENTLSNVNMFYRDRINIIIGFKKGKGKDQLPRKDVPNKFTFNESEIDASEFLPENKNEKEGKNLTLELDRCLQKTQGKKQNLKNILQKEQN